MCILLLFGSFILICIIKVNYFVCEGIILTCGLFNVVIYVGYHIDYNVNLVILFVSSKNGDLMTAARFRDTLGCVRLDKEINARSRLLGTDTLILIYHP